MGNYVVVKQVISPAYASTILANENYHGQRAIRPLHVEYLANEMRNNRFLSGTDIHFCELDGYRHLVNGQHTLSAIVKSEIPQTLTVKIIPCQTMLEVAATFAAIDRQMSRTVADVYHAYDFASKVGLTTTDAGELCKAANFLQRDVFRTIKRKPSPHETMDIAERLLLRYVTYQSAISGQPKELAKLFDRQAIVAAAICTYSHPKSYEFWNGAAMDDGLKRNDPRKSWLNYFRESRERGGSYSQTTKNQVGGVLAFKITINTFNKFAAGDDLSCIRTESIAKFSGIPPMKGTEFSKGFTIDAFNSMLKG